MCSESKKVLDRVNGSSYSKGMSTNKNITKTFEIQGATFVVVATLKAYLDGTARYAVMPDGAVNLKGADGTDFYNVRSAEVKVRADGAPVYITNGDFFFNARNGLTEGN